MNPWLLISALTIGAVAIVNASAMTADEFNGARQIVRDQYRVAVLQCRDLGGNQHDICVAEAKAQRDKTAAQLEADYRDTPRARAQALRQQADADFKLAQQICDDLSGQAKQACVADARAAYENYKLQIEHMQ